MIYYSPKPLLEKAESLDCPTIITVGGKGIGKTFGFIQYFMEQYFEGKGYLRYVRRYRDSIAPKAIASLLSPQRQNIINLSKGKWNSCKYYRNRFYFVREEEGEVIAKSSEPFMICSALNAVESYTGADEGLCCGIFFDEFLSRERQLPNEYESLMIMHSNCWRNRGNRMPLVLAGNPFSRNSAISRDFGINLYKIKENSVTIFKGKDNRVNVIVERCPDSTGLQQASDEFYSRFNDGRLNMITSGKWALPDYPRIANRYVDASDELFRCRCVFETNFIMSVLLYHDYYFVYVHDDDKCDVNVTLVNKVTPLKGDLLNYYPNDIAIFTKIAKLIVRKQIYFEHGDLGEMFRDFMLNLNGASKIGGLFK